MGYASRSWRRFRRRRLQMANVRVNTQTSTTILHHLPTPQRRVPLCSAPAISELHNHGPFHQKQQEQRQHSRLNFRARLGLYFRQEYTHLTSSDCDKISEWEKQRRLQYPPLQHQQRPSQRMVRDPHAPCLFGIVTSELSARCRKQRKLPSAFPAGSA